MIKTTRITAITLILSLLLPLSTFAKDLVVYSARKEHLIAPIFKAYTAKTGVEIE